MIVMEWNKKWYFIDISLKKIVFLKYHWNIKNKMTSKYLIWNSIEKIYWESNWNISLKCNEKYFKLKCNKNLSYKILLKWLILNIIQFIIFEIILIMMLYFEFYSQKKLMQILFK